jgi:hypothetical protein
MLGIAEGLDKGLRAIFPVGTPWRLPYCFDRTGDAFTVTPPFRR